VQVRASRYHTLVRRFFAIAAAAVVLASPVAAEAGSCTNITVPAVAFGTQLTPGTANVVQLTIMSTVCSTGTPYTILFGPGAHPTTIGPTAHRQIAAGPNLMVYDIYTNASRTTFWGDGANVIGSGVATTGTGGTQQFAVYSVISVPSNAIIGSYSDSVVVTLSF
jgi:spore coat protein U-like protein